MLGPDFVIGGTFTSACFCNRGGLVLILSQEAVGHQVALLCAEDSHLQLLGCEVLWCLIIWVGDFSLLSMRCFPPTEFTIKSNKRLQRFFKDGQSINQSIKFYLYSPYSQTTVSLIGL